ncbi:MAG TPA: hypothetical protein VH986_08475 [Acidimicrobiia bacterium]
MLKLLIRLTLLGLAAYGAKVLYDRFAPKIQDMQGPARDFAERAASIAGDTAEQAKAAARQGAAAMSGAVDDLGRAAEDAKDTTQNRLATG